LIEDNSVKSKSTILFNTQATYILDSKTRLRLDVFNVFNRQADDIAYFYTSRLPGEPPEGVNDLHFHPSERRSFRVALLYAF
jgi:outer membrane receptor protein involved in Fe transport